jgi:hypothetical protein
MFILQFQLGMSVQDFNQQQRIGAPDSRKAVIGVVYAQHSSPDSNLASGEEQGPSK